MERSLSLPRYTLRFRNGLLLHHQGPLALAQFRCDGRLAEFWLESEPLLVGSESSGPRGH